MNREKKNKIPSMQVGFIDAVCLQLYEVWYLRKNSKYLKPELFTGRHRFTIRIKIKLKTSPSVRKIFFILYCIWFIILLKKLFF